jgi:hypothetical protein
LTDEEEEGERIKLEGWKGLRNFRGDRFFGLLGLSKSISEESRSSPSI